MGEAKDSLKKRVYYAARDGMAITLFALLADVPEDEVSEYLDQLIEEDDEKCTPLIVAAKNGHNNVVQMILTKFEPNVEIEGVVQFDGYVIEGATPLWCAAGAGHLSVVRSLVFFGADVNHPTHTNSTPLRAACFNGRLDIVRFLVEHDADIHKANKYNNTCLMISAYKGHLHIVRYLLRKNANCDAHAHCGATALHFAAELGHLEIIRELLDHRAKISKTVTNMTPLITAAERTRSEVVEFFIDQPWCSKEEKIEALELLGASFANDKDRYSLDRAYYYMEWAMKERYSDVGNPVPKQLLPPIPAYENRVECQTLQELESIKQDANALHMESLTIRERILGPRNPEVPHPIIFRGAVFADSARFDRCIQLWLHALNLRFANNTSVHKDLLRFAQVFSQMLHIGFDIAFSDVERVLEIAIGELERNLENLRSHKDGGQEAHQEELDDNIHIVLYLLVIVTKLLKQCRKDEELHVYQLVYRLNQLPLETKDGSTPLHLTVNASTPVDDFHTKNVCKFPCAATARLLIRCGAKVNAIDHKRNTPLHVIVKYQKPVSDFMTLHDIITSLIDAGAHMDSVNNNGETPFDAATTGVAEIILRTEAKLSLKCMAAKAVKKFNLTYTGQVPHTLVTFIEMHGVAPSPQLSVG